MGLKLKHIQIRNWAKIDSADIQFPERGLVMVIGRNMASGGAFASIGAGKSSFGEAISRTLFGRLHPQNAETKTHAKDYSTDQKGNTYVRLECVLDDKPLVVESGYKCQELSKSGEALQYTWNGEKTQRQRIPETRDLLLKLLGIDSVLVPWSIFIDGDNLRFGKLSQATSVDTVMAALRQPPWSVYHKQAKDTLDQYAREINFLEGQLSAANARVADNQDALKAARQRVKIARETYKEETKKRAARQQRSKLIIESVEKSIEKNDSRRRQIAKEIKQIEEAKAADHHRLEIKIRDREEDLRKLKNKRKERAVAWQEARDKATAANSRYLDYRDAERTCPTCKRPLDGEKLDKKRLQELQEASEKARQAVAEPNRQVADADNQMDVLEDELDALREELRTLDVENRIRELSATDRALEKSTQQLMLEIDEIREEANRPVSKTDLQTWKAVLNERKQSLKSAKKALRQTQAELKEAKEMHKVVDYWTRAFSPYGIPNMILKEALAPLNAEARRISSLMTGGTIEVGFKTRRELASGQEKAELIVQVKNTIGGAHVAHNSKGESRLTNLIIAEAMSEVGQITRQIGYRWYDEVLTNLDEISRTNVIRYLRELAHRLNVLIFVVDHHAETANFADHVLRVEKLPDSAKLGWVQ